nr:hypothetical protein [Tanacetum cinerariifolium]
VNAFGLGVITHYHDCLHRKVLPNVTYRRKDLQCEFLHVESENEDGEKNFGGAQNEGMGAEIRRYMPGSAKRELRLATQQAF